MNKIALDSFLQAEMRRVWSKFLTLYPAMRARTMPRAALNNRLKSTAGRCFYESNQLDFSTSLLQEFPEHFAQDTIPHEIAHQIAYTLFADRGHGKPWKSVMLAYGIEPARCHNLLDLRINNEQAK